MTIPEELKYWSPTEVAECIGGLGDDLYRKLWHIESLKPTQFTEEPVVQKHDWWKQLSVDELQTVVDAYAKEYSR